MVKSARNRKDSSSDTASGSDSESRLRRQCQNRTSQNLSTNSKSLERWKDRLLGVSKDVHYEVDDRGILVFNTTSASEASEITTTPAFLRKNKESLRSSSQVFSVPEPRTKSADKADTSVSRCKDVGLKTTQNLTTNSNQLNQYLTVSLKDILKDQKALTIQANSKEGDESSEFSSTTLKSGHEDIINRNNHSFRAHDSADDESSILNSSDSTKKKVKRAKCKETRRIFRATSEDSKSSSARSAELNLRDLRRKRNDIQQRQQEKIIVKKQHQSTKDTVQTLPGEIYESVSDSLDEQDCLKNILIKTSGTTQSTLTSRVNTSTPKNGKQEQSLATKLSEPSRDKNSSSRFDRGNDEDDISMEEICGGDDQPRKSESVELNLQDQRRKKNGTQELVTRQHQPTRRTAQTLPDDVSESGSEPLNEKDFVKNSIPITNSTTRSLLTVGANASALRKKKQEEKRWISEYLMLSRLLEQKEPVTLELSQSNSTIDNLTNIEWKLATGVTQILEPLYEATTDLCADTYPSKIIPVIHCVQKMLQEDFTKTPSQFGIAFARNFSKSILSFFPLYPSNKLFLLAMALDPRFKT